MGEGKEGKGGERGEGKGEEDKKKEGEGTSKHSPSSKFATTPLAVAEC